GLSGAGKSTLAYAVERKLFDMGRAVFVLDGQNLRHDLNKGLPQDRAGRTENWRRAAHVARQFNEAHARRQRRMASVTVKGDGKHNGHIG
ncbi:adenylyl-sulfate kinase, partial [Klebsiella pneumoniae]|uniref:adenylyl-sulfate kinase n=1 Tax=Klebsiella pneumoniae TaxID=573 RepID=UPI002731816E